MVTVKTYLNWKPIIPQQITQNNFLRLIWDIVIGIAIVRVLTQNVLTINADVLQIINMIIQVEAVNILRVPGIPNVKNTITIDIAVPAIVIAIAAIILILLMVTNVNILILLAIHTLIVMTTHGFGFWWES